MFDSSDYPKDSKFSGETNKKVMGKMKDESEGKIIDDFVVLKSKLYSMKNIDGNEKFIDTCLKFYELDPCHYFSSPGLSLDAMLKMTGVKLEKISDIDKYLFIEKGLRGISYTAKRYAKANNKYMKYKPKKPLITYLDMNNLYGWEMNAYLPYERFKWLKCVVGFDIMSISEKSPIGYIFEVDLEYPGKLHTSHNDYPLPPEKLAISSDMLSDYCKKNCRQV